MAWHGNFVTPYETFPPLRKGLKAKSWCSFKIARTPPDRAAANHPA
jgi:hypothetical protein